VRGNSALAWGMAERLAQGKSTLMNVVSDGMYQTWRAGSISVYGKMKQKILENPNSCYPFRIGMVHQKHFKLIGKISRLQKYYHWYGAKKDGYSLKLEQAAVKEV